MNNNSDIYVSMNEILKAIATFEESRNRLEILINNTRKNKDDLINSNMSGEMYKVSIENNELFVSELEERKKELDDLIDNLKDIQNIYNQYIMNVQTSVKGG